MTADHTTFSTGDLLDFAVEALQAVGTGKTNAHDMASQILGSELAGHESHGFRRLPEYVARALDGLADPAATGHITSESGAVVCIDGDGGFGHVVMRHATRIAVARARQHGIAALTVRNAEYVGRFADFCAQAADEGVATLVFVNCSGAAQVAGPPGALEARLGTNPIAAGVPRQRAPHLVVDMATTAVAMGRVAEWRDRGEHIPPEWVNGHGVLQHMAGAKGFALALVAEALAGGLSGAGTVSAEPASDRQGVLLIAMDVARFRPLEGFTAAFEESVDYVRSVPVEPGAQAVRLPGDTFAADPHRRGAGLVVLQPFTRAALVRVAERLGIAPPTASTPSAAVAPS